MPIKECQEGRVIEIRKHMGFSDGQSSDCGE